MKQTIPLKKTLTLILIVAFSMISSCSSDDSKSDGTNPKDISIVGKWYAYKMVIGGSTYTGNQICDTYPNCNKYDFQTNACVFTEESNITNYEYKIDGDFIKFYNPQTGVLKHTYKINSLTQNELVLELTDKVNYYKRF